MRLLDTTESRTIILIAPAGYGKTTLAQQWLAQRPHGLYRATASSSDVAAFALGLAESLGPVMPRIRERVARHLRQIREPLSHAGALAELMQCELTDWPAEAWLAIDDYHFAAESTASNEFFEQLVETSEINVLLTSRERPVWASARRLLYGDIYEIGQAVLAMTEDEANQILRQPPEGAAAGLVALAEGWPAVIGLAAMADTSLPANPFPETLNRYFAEELYQRVSPELRNALTMLAAVPSLDRKVISAMFGSPTDARIFTEAPAIGFLIAQPDGTFEMNPLIRTFLESRMVVLDRRFCDQAVRRLLDWYTEKHAWDEAHALILATGKIDLLPWLLEMSLEELLASGRVATLTAWVKTGSETGITHPVLDLTEAELAFRRGEHLRAEALAAEAARNLKPDGRLYARAELRAGQAAYFNDRHDEALESFERARASSKDIELTREATWGSFVTAIDLELTNVNDFLAAYEKLPNERVDDIVRLAGGRLSQGHRQSGLRAALTRARSVNHLAEHVDDPMIRSAFFNSYGWGLILGAYYEDAIRAAEQVEAVAQEYGLEFAIAHARLVTAYATVGMGEHTKGFRLLNELDALAKRREDDFLAVNARTLRARLLIADHRFDDAVALTDPVPGFSESRGTCGERLAVRALALIGAGRPGDASNIARDARESSKSLAPTILSNLASAVIALDEQGSTEPIKEVSQEAALEGHFDELVLVYRMRPKVIPILCETIADGELLSVIGRARDEGLAEEAGIPMGPSRRAMDSVLSPREREVCELLAEGHTNAEIADVLYISEVTVKVHVRHILAKLGLRNRSEAAVYAATRLRGDLRAPLGTQKDPAHLSASRLQP